MHPARKFSQNLCKNKTLNIQSAFNKENDKNSLTESFAKKFSVGSHVVSDDCDPFKHKKSIIDQKISVFLEQSQNKAVLFQKPTSQNQIRYLNKVLQNGQGTMVEILSQQIQRNQFKNQDLKKLVETLIEKLTQDEKTTSSYSQDSFRLTDHIMKPYLEQQILLLQKNLSRLKSRQQDLVIVKGMDSNSKKFLIQNLKQMQQTQKKQLDAFEKIKCY